MRPRLSFRFGFRGSLMATLAERPDALVHIPGPDYRLPADVAAALSGASADQCQTTMVKRNVVMRALQRLPVGAHVVWLDQFLPMYRKDAFEQEATISMWKSTYHRFRGITIFCRRDAAISHNVTAAINRKATARAEQFAMGSLAE